MSWSNISSSRRLRAVATGAVTLVALTTLTPLTAFAIQPDAKTVPWVASNPSIPHDAFRNEATILKCTSSVAGPTIEYTWDFGDGSVVQSGLVVGADDMFTGNQRTLYGIDAAHAYDLAVGTIVTAKCTVRDTSTGESDSANYFVQIRAKKLEAEVNVAIDRGLWYLHKAMRRNNVGGAETGDWLTCPAYNGGPSGSMLGCEASSGYYAATPNNVTAFLANGHLETGSPDNPYTETVKRAMRRVFQLISATGITLSKTTPEGTYTVDTNANSFGLFPNQTYLFYQSGMFFNAMVATGTPDAVTTTGAPTYVLGRKYKDIVQDMVDYVLYCQYEASGGGGWRYGCKDFPDNSATQWVAIGLIAAERGFGAFVPIQTKNWNKDWIAYSQAVIGAYGYTSTAPIWGPYATTPSGQVQNAFVGQGRGQTNWDRGETFLRDNFCNDGSAVDSLKHYYYGLFSFTKSMLQHDSNGDGVAEPLQMLQSKTAGVTPIDWYAAETSAGAPCNGVARTLVNDQKVLTGSWYGNNYTGDQFPFETAWAILMLNRSVFEGGQPVALIAATPNPAVASQTIQLSGADSFHQDPARLITSWKWDLDNDGSFDDATGPLTTVSFPSVGNYPVRLQVCDNGTSQLCDDATLIINVATPPLAPTANAGGPYDFCPNRTPYLLDGTKSVNPDDGLSEPGQPPDFIKEFAWDLNLDSNFGDATGSKPDVTAYFSGVGPGSYIVQLRVTDNTKLSFPSSGLNDLTSVDSATVYVRSSTHPVCGCVSNLAARPKLTKVQLTWTYAALPPGGKYNVYRGTVNGGPYLKIAETQSTYSTYLDSAAVTNTTYYYVVRPANASGVEFCQSNQASAKPVAR